MSLRRTWAPGPLDRGTSETVFFRERGKTLYAEDRNSQPNYRDIAWNVACAGDEVLGCRVSVRLSQQSTPQRGEKIMSSSRRAARLDCGEIRLCAGREKTEPRTGKSPGFTFRDYRGLCWKIACGRLSKHPTATQQSAGGTGRRAAGDFESICVDDPSAGVFPTGTVSSAEAHGGIAGWPRPACTFYHCMGTPHHPNPTEFHL